MASDGKMKQYEAMFLVGPIGTAEPENALNICKQMIERHGGQITVESEPGRGSTFTFSLPKHGETP